MYSYYTHIPDSDFPTAEVEASSTKHARTAYLDYLSRNGRIGWQDRQALRSKILAQRMQPGEFQTQVVLDYSASDVPERVIEAAPEQGELVDPERLEVASEEQVEFDPETMGSLLTGRGVYTKPGTESLPQRPAPRPDLFDPGQSRIAQLSKRSKGM